VKEAIDKVLGKSPVKASQKRPPKMASKPKKNLDLVEEEHQHEEGEPSGPRVPVEDRKVPNKRKLTGETNPEKPVPKKKVKKVKFEDQTRTDEPNFDVDDVDVGVGVAEADFDDLDVSPEPKADDSAVEPEISKTVSNLGNMRLSVLSHAAFVSLIDVYDR
jgi:hypothetical protein